MRLFFKTVLSVYFVVFVPISLIAQKRIISVSDSKQIQTQLDQAQEGDTVLFKAGFYPKLNLMVNKLLHLRGEGEVILSAADTGSIVTINHSGVTVENLHFHNAPISFIREYAAIRINEVQHVTIKNSYFKDNFFAIYSLAGKYLMIDNNHITATGRRESNSGNAIHFWNTSNSTVQNNFMEGHRDGIYLEFSKKINVINNVSERQLRYGLHFMLSDSSSYSGNRFVDNGAGIAVMYSKYIIMHDNIFINNKGSNTYGLLLKEIYDSEIRDNLFYDNTIALYLEASNRLWIHHNRIEKNGWAVNLKANSTDNRFEENNFIGNVFDVATNSRQNYNSMDSNYWSQYSGYDLNNDHIGDTPYRPARLFGALINKLPLAMILVNSQFAQLLDWVDAIMPVFTPESLKDNHPRMKPVNL